jgi:hypothetical protein
MLKWWAWVAVIWIREVDDGNDGLEGVGCLGTGLPGNQSLTVELTSKRPPFTFASASPVESEDQGSYVCLGMVRDVGLSAVCRSKLHGRITERRKFVMYYPLTLRTRTVDSHRP